MLSTERMEGLRSSLRGEIIAPGDPEYEAARKVFNGMIDRHPRLIARCRDVADVIAAVNFARDTGLLLAVRGGGHNAGGLGVCDDGLVIDLSPMKGIRVDPAARTVRVEGGCIWRDVDHATHSFGLATPSGMISSTGVAGLTLGGGIGHLSRSCGLTVDNLLEADLVLADGSFVTASTDSHPDLFWAIRGGGGNFGVVTSFLFRLHPVDTVYAGPMFWSLDQAADMMHWYRDFILRAPGEISGFFAFLVVPPAPPFPEHLHGKNVCGIVWCYTGPLAQAEATFAPIRATRPPLLDLVGPIPFTALQGMFDPLYPPGLQWYWKADFFTELGDKAIALNVRYGSALPTMLSTTHLYPINGVPHRVGRTDTAFSFREAVWAQVIVGIDPDPAAKERIVTWAREYWDALHPYSSGGAYVNFMMEEGNDRIRATYRDNYDRLVAVKKRYDPTNLFRVNQNIRPSG